MRRRRIVAAAAVFALALVIGSVVEGRARTGATPVYTVAQVTAGLDQHPAAWSGRTVEVRGRAVIPLCVRTSPCRLSLAFLVDLDRTGRRLRLAWTRVNPLLAGLLRLPYLGGVVAGRVGGVGVYRVRLVHATIVVPAQGLPAYYPYTSKTTVAYDDEALLVNGLS